MFNQDLVQARVEVHSPVTAVDGRSCQLVRVIQCDPLAPQEHRSFWTSDASAPTHCNGLSEFIRMFDDKYRETSIDQHFIEVPPACFAISKSTPGAEHTLRDSVIEALANLDDRLSGDRVKHWAMQV